jgi:hypothetical protein
MERHRDVRSWSWGAVGWGGRTGNEAFHPAGADAWRLCVWGRGGRMGWGQVLLAESVGGCSRADRRGRGAPRASRLQVGSTTLAAHPPRSRSRARAPSRCRRPPPSLDPPAPDPVRPISPLGTGVAERTTRITVGKPRTKIGRPAARVAAGATPRPARAAGPALSRRAAVAAFCESGRCPCVSSHPAAHSLHAASLNTPRCCLVPHLGASFHRPPPLPPTRASARSTPPPSPDRLAGLYG